MLELWKTIEGPGIIEMHAWPAHAIRNKLKWSIMFNCSTYDTVSITFSTQMIHNIQRTISWIDKKNIDLFFKLQCRNQTKSRISGREFFSGNHLVSANSIAHSINLSINQKLIEYVLSEYYYRWNIGKFNNICICSHWVNLQYIMSNFFSRFDEPYVAIDRCV